MSIRVGIDLVAVATVAESMTGPHGELYLARVYTSAERRDCTGPDGPDPSRLAARFAAKEATLKVLATPSEGIAWTTMEVVRDTDGFVRVALHGRAAELAAAAGIRSLALSLSHEAGLAAAVVVATIDEAPSR